MPVMRILDSSGDTVIEWNHQDHASVERARRIFCQMHAQRRVAFAVPPDGGVAASHQIQQFDPTATDDIVWVRAAQGG
jgi:hypothetical protein